MRYKENVLNKLSQTDIIINTLQLQINRNASQEELSETVDKIKESLISVNDIVSVEDDEFERQFSPQ